MRENLKRNMEENEYIDPEYDEMDEWEDDDIESQEEHGDLLTITEMKELLQQEPYKLDEGERHQPELLFDEKTGKYYTDYFKNQYEDHILLRHILAEECVAHKEELDWGRVTNGYDTAILAKIVGLYYTPLAWCKLPVSLTERYIIVGKFAKEVEEDRPGRMDLVIFLLDEAREKRAVWFADHLPERGIAKWEIFLTNYHRADLLKALSPNADYYFQLPNVSAFWLKENLEYVISYRGIHKAQEVLDRLRKDWNHLVKLNLCNFDKLTKEEVESLREYVFDTVNYQMDIWKIEAGEEEEVVTEGKRFSLLTDECHAEKKEAKVISELRAACKGTAVGLWKVIRENEALGYLCTRGMQTSKIYRAIVDYFGELPYTERNFRDARDKK